jgi:hypothetical protein
MCVAAFRGAFTAGSLQGPLEIAVGCVAVLLAEGLALLALMPENLRARVAARVALVIGALALVLAAVMGIGYWRVCFVPAWTAAAQEAIRSPPSAPQEAAGSSPS